MRGRESASEAERPRRPGFWTLFRRNHLAVAGLAFVGLFVLAALAAPVLPIPDPDATMLGERLLPPLSAGHALGTDHLGRDILSRLLWGARLSLAVAVLATLLAAVVGSFIGIVAGFYAGWLDTLLMRGIDTLMAFPYMLLALAIVAVLGPGLMNALFAVAIVNIPFFARTVRGATVGQAGRPYVDAARLSGFTDTRILATEVLPNVLPTIVVTIATTVGWMILETAGLSFLGLGAQPPQADLGSMLGEGRKVFIVAPHVAAIPGLVILFLVMGINLVADGVRDTLDPRLRSGALARPEAATEVRREEPGEGTGEAENAILEVRNLGTWFFTGRGVVKAVDGISFAVAPGECLGIVGESGSGKSVAALSVLGLVPTPPGRIVGGAALFHGDDLIGVPLETLQDIRGNRIAYIFQDPSTTLNPLFTVGEQIAETIRRHGSLSRHAARRKAVELLETARIADPEARIDYYPHALSGGQRQRVAIAMALANDPEVLIADEPTTAIDVTTQARILELLDSLRRERNLALVFITHDFGIVREICDRVVVMRHGRIVETGPVDRVFAEPRHDYTRTLIEAVPKLGAGEST